MTLAVALMVGVLCIRVLFMKDLLHFLMHAALLLLWSASWVMLVTHAEATHLDLVFTFVWMTFLIFLLMGSILWVRVLRERKHPAMEDEVSL